MTSRTLTLLLLLASLFLAAPMVAVHEIASSAVAEQPTDSPTRSSSRSADTELFRYVGAASCATAGCHGHPDQARTATLGREYRIWMQADPHSRAYETLFSAKSKSIASRLKLGRAHEAAECLSCHSLGASSAQLAPYHRHTIRDGVSCESCHGPAEKWLALHTTIDWRALSVSERAEYGFRDTGDLQTRAKACAACHVGAKGKDVNHDLIAAGHPPLRHELAANLAKLPRHWSRAKDKLEHGSEFEAKLWVVGQLESLGAAAELLSHRASDPAKPWSEFAEYDCFACHQDLEQQPNSRVGAPSWGSWHVPMLAQALPQSADLRATVEQLRALMKGPYASVDRELAEQAAGNVRRAIDSTVAELTATAFDRNAVLQRLVRVTAPSAGAAQDLTSTWDDAAQRYLAAVALRQALVDSFDVAGEELPEAIAESQSELKKIREALAFPANLESPLGYRREEKGKQIEAFFQLIHDRLKPLR